MEKNTNLTPDPLFELSIGAKDKRSPKKTRFPNTSQKPGVFSSLPTRKVADTFHEFQLNAPVWSPGVTARRFISIPDGLAATPDETGIWKFPEGTLIVQHFETNKGLTLETQDFYRKPGFYLESCGLSME